MNVNSVKNQQIKHDFVYREVYACISDMAEYLFDYDGDGYASFDEFENYEPTLRCPHCGNEVEEKCEASDSEEETSMFYCSYCDRDIDPCDVDEEYPEIYEYWLVSPWLGAKLKDHGEVVLERYGAWVWGRQCTGQAILLDGVISRICEGIGLLEDEEEAV